MNLPRTRPVRTRPVGLARALVCGAVLAGACASLVGCQHQYDLTKGTADEDLDFYKRFPAPVDVPIDPALNAAARQELAAQLRSDVPTDRAHAIEGYRTTLPDEAATPVMAALDDRSPIVRFAATMAVGELQLAAAQTKVLAMVADPDPRVQVGVRLALHRLGDSSRTAELERYAKDAGPLGTQVRGTTAMVLGRLGEKTAIRVLLLLRLDKESAVRQQAEEGLALLGDPSGLNAIFGLTVAALRYEQTFAMRTLAELKNPKYRAYARQKLNSEYPEVALAATMAMGAMDADDGYVLAMKGMRASEWQGRALAAAAFGTIGRTDAQKILAPGLKDSSSDVRAATATALLQIAREPKRYARTGERLQ